MKIYLIFLLLNKCKGLSKLIVCWCEVSKSVLYFFNAVADGKRPVLQNLSLLYLIPYSSKLECFTVNHFLV
jgi:hypothetical protein